MAFLIIERNFVFKLTFLFCVGNVSFMDITEITHRLEEVGSYTITLSDDRSVAYVRKFGYELARFDLSYYDGRHTATLTELRLVSHYPNSVHGSADSVQGAIVNSLDLLIYAVNNLAMKFAKD